MRIRQGLAMAGLMAGVALVAACDPGSAPPPESRPTSQPTPAEEQTRRAVVSPFLALRRGAAPGFGYVRGRVHTDPDGAQTRLPMRYGISEIARYDGGLLMADARYFEGTSGLHIITDSGRAEVEPCTSGGGVVSRDGSQAAWATFACPETGQSAPLILHRQSPAGTTSQHISVPEGTNARTSVAGLLGEDVVYNTGSPGAVFVSDLEGEPRPVDGVSWVASADEVGSRVAGAAGTDSRHGVVVDLASQEVQWRARRTRLGPFNPSGTAIVAARGQAWTVRDADNGLELYALDVPERVRLSHLAWEDDRHLLAVMTWRHEVAIIRFDGHGLPELATEVMSSPGPHPGYILESLP